MKSAIREPKKKSRYAFTLPSMRSAVLSLAFILFIGLCVLPVVYMIGVSLVNSQGGISLGNYRRLLFEPRQRELLLNSMLLGASSAMFGTLLGAPLGLFLARAR